MKTTKIEWTEHSWNPVIGCTKISEGCKNCYAEKMAKWLCVMGNESYFPVVDPKGWTGKTNFAESQLNKPFKFKKSSMFFVVSMGDLFHESVPFEWVDKTMTVIASNPHHIFQVLTKRPKQMNEYFNYEDISWMSEKMMGFERIRYYCYHNNGMNIEYEDFYPLKNLWLGVTTENQKWADERIPELLKIPAKVRFLSIEPCLGYISLFYHTSCFTSVDWVIVGSESGPNRRPAKLEWIESIVDQCQTANVPVFVKQLEINGKLVKDINKFPKHLQLREYPI